MSFEINESCAHRIEEAMRRQDEMRRRAEKGRVTGLQGEMRALRERKGTPEKAVSKGMEIIRKGITDIMRRKEEQDEHTIQERSLGALRIVTADQG